MGRTPKPWAFRTFFLQPSPVSSICAPFSSRPYSFRVKGSHFFPALQFQNETGRPIWNERRIILAGRFFRPLIISASGRWTLKLSGPAHE